MSRFPVVAFLVAVLPLQALSGQWRVGADVAALRFAPVAQQTGAGGQRTTLTDATSAALRIERQVGRLRLGLGIAHATSGFAVGDRDLVVEARDVFHLWEFAPEVAVRIAGADAHPTVWLHAGPVLGVWLPERDETRARTGAQAGASLAFPLHRRLSGAVRVAGSVTPCVFDAAELPPGFERRATRRLDVALGVRYRL
jgi:hypothetical protein